MKYLILSISFLVLLNHQLSAATRRHGCEQFLLEKKLNNTTETLIAYLDQLIEAKIISNGELVKFIESINKASIKNPIDEEQTWDSTAHLIHRDEIQKFLQMPDLNHEHLLRWANLALNEQGRVSIKREETQVATKDTYQKIEFHPVSPGTFQVGESSNIAEVTLTQPIEVMSTPVTQKNWADIMGSNPSKFVLSEDSIVATIRGKMIAMNPDNPVENLTWWSAIVFANTYSERANLLPAYDLTGIEFVDLSPTKRRSGVLRSPQEIFEVAAGGTLSARNPNATPKINAPNGNIFQTVGYRLPTEAEQEFLVWASTIGVKESELNDYVWNSDNAKNKTHPVTLLKPTTISGKLFFDVRGNVWEWGNDWFSPVFHGGINPLGPTSGKTRVVRSGSWANLANIFSASPRHSESPNFREADTGLRLVRSLTVYR